MRPRGTLPMRPKAHYPRGPGQLPMRPRGILPMSPGAAEFVLLSLMPQLSDPLTSQVLTSLADTDAVNLEFTTVLTGRGRGLPRELPVKGATPSAGARRELRGRGERGASAPASRGGAVGTVLPGRSRGRAVLGAARDPARSSCDPAVSTATRGKGARGSRTRVPAAALPGHVTPARLPPGVRRDPPARGAPALCRPPGT